MKNRNPEKDLKPLFTNPIPLNNSVGKGVAELVRRMSEQNTEGKKFIVGLMAVDADYEPKEASNAPYMFQCLEWSEKQVFSDRPYKAPGTWVSVAPCAPEFKGETYLGIYIGDIALSCGASFGMEDDGGYDLSKPVLGFSMHNPAIWVPDLNKVIFGAGSYWRRIESPDDLKKITNADIGSVWYVKALKELTEGASN